ncbi:MAG: DNA polymerase III subunit delta [Planctomycetes bacterium]|nr:DNA polymerase III subunit delta [Planctomycetota bacterium]
MTQSASYKPVYVVFGSDTYLKQETVTGISRAVLGDDDAAGGATRFDGDKATLADVLDEVRTFSLLGEARLVIVDDADPFITRHRQSLETYCAAPSNSGVPVLVCKSSAANTKLHRAIQALGGVIVCQTPRGSDLAAWIVRQARERYEKQIEGPAVGALRESCDDSLGMFDGELAKLASYVGDRKRITAQDVHALVGQHREVKVFAVTDAMADGNPAAALQAWEQALATNRATPMLAVGGLAWSIRRLLGLRHAMDKGADVRSLSQQGRMSPAQIQSRVGGVSARRLEDQLTDLLQIDLDSKTGLGNVNRGVEKFIVRHSRRAAAG